MSAPAVLAYGYARARARKSRVIPAAVLVGLVTADQPALTIPGWRDVENDHDAAALVSLLYARLIDDYVTMIRAYPAARVVLLALARLHELENVKLAWRVALGSVPPAEWRDCWRPMGALETISRTACEATSSPRHVGRASVGTPYEAIAKAVSGAHPGDLAAAEIAFDRWGSRELANATRALSESEGAARDLVWRVLRERDIALMERAVGPLGLPPESAVRMTTILADELGAAAAANHGQPIAGPHVRGGPQPDARKPAQGLPARVSGAAVLPGAADRARASSGRRSARAVIDRRTARSARAGGRGRACTRSGRVLTCSVPCRWCTSRRRCRAATDRR